MNWSASTLRMLGMALGLGTTLMMSSCGGGIDVVSKGVQPVFAGSYDTATPPNSNACYWEGTIRFDLAGETGSVSSHAYSPSATVQGYIYTPGTWTDSSNNTHACYWTGTTRTDLTVTGAINTYATCITLSGSDRYVGGYYTTDGTTYIPCYWKNDTDGFQALGAVGSKAYVTGIGVDSRVFCSGYYLSGTDTVACYWDSPAPALPKVLNLPGGSTQAMAYGIVVANKTPWIVGHYTSGTTSVPCYWKETTKYDLSLPAGAGSADVYAISTKGSNASGYLYCAGYYHDGTKNVPIYWGINNIEETTPTEYNRWPLSDPSNYDARAYAIFSSGGDLWIGGNYLNTASGSSVSVPCYWKGGERTNLPDGTSAARIACGPDVP